MYVCIVFICMCDVCVCHNDKSSISKIVQITSPHSINAYFINTCCNSTQDGSVGILITRSKMKHTRRVGTFSSNRDCLCCHGKYGFLSRYQRMTNCPQVKMHGHNESYFYCWPGLLHFQCRLQVVFHQTGIFHHKYFLCFEYKFSLLR